MYIAFYIVCGIVIFLVSLLMWCVCASTTEYDRLQDDIAFEQWAKEYQRVHEVK